MPAPLDGSKPEKDAGDRLALVPRSKQTAVVVSQSYGKGKLVPRTKTGAGKLAFPPARVGGALTSRAASRWVSWLEEGILNGQDLRKEEQGEAAWQLLRRCQPVHITNSGITGPAASSLSSSKLEEFFEHGPDIRAATCISKERCIMDYNEETNVFGSHYHVREPRTKYSSMTFEAASQHLQQWSERGILVKIPIKKLIAGDGNDMNFQLSSAPECPEALQNALDDVFDWDWVKNLKNQHRMGSMVSAELQLGSKDLLLPAQYCIRDRLLIQMSRTRKLLVIDPSHSFKGMYSYPVHHPYDTYSMVDWEKPDQEDWTMCSGVRGKACTLQAGNILFVPSNWWVMQHLPDAGSVTMSITLGLGQIVRPHPAIALRVSRNVEEVLGDLQGPGKILHWLQILADEREMEIIDVFTNEGYQQIRAVWDARDDVDSVLGRRAWKTLFQAMSQGRLRPTPWLNKDFVEPLYLEDKPRRIFDTRTEEQQKYPELFRHVKW